VCPVDAITDDFDLTEEKELFLNKARDFFS